MDMTTMDMTSAAQGAVDGSTLLKVVISQRSFRCVNCRWQISDGGEVIPESRGLTSGRAAQASPYHSLRANGSRFADRAHRAPTSVIKLLAEWFPFVLSTYCQGRAICHKML
jgi:hypothetical protein